MKRVFIYLLTLLPVLAVVAGCDKETFDPEKPAITWESNSSFAVAELTNALDANVTVAVPGKFQNLKLVLGLGQYNILANQYIKINSNKGGSTNPIFDLINDESSVGFVKGLGMNVGTALRNQEQVKLNLKAILEALALGQIVENNTTFSIEIQVEDQAGNTLSKTARFHFTAAPSYTWAKNAGFSEVDLDGEEIDCNVEIWAPGKFESLTLKLEDGAAPWLVDRVKKRTTGGVLVIDLVNDAIAAEGFKNYFPSGNAVAGKENAKLDFSFMFVDKYDLEPSTNIFTITAVDRNGKESVQQVKFKKN